MGTAKEEFKDPTYTSSFAHLNEASTSGFYDPLLENEYTAPLPPPVFGDSTSSSSMMSDDEPAAAAATGNASVAMTFDSEDLWKFSKVFVAGAFGKKPVDVSFYEVPVFELPPFMLSHRKYVVKDGMVLLPKSELIQLVNERYKVLLTQALKL